MDWKFTQENGQLLSYDHAKALIIEYLDKIKILVAECFAIHLNYQNETPDQLLHIYSSMMKCLGIAHRRLAVATDAVIPYLDLDILMKSANDLAMELSKEAEARADKKTLSVCHKIIEINRIYDDNS